MADASPRDCTPGPPPALGPRRPRCSKLCMQPELAFCGGEVDIEFRAIVLVGFAASVFMQKHEEDLALF